MMGEQMLIRIRKTGDIVFADEFRRLNASTSFPAVLTADLLNDFGADEVLEGQQPALSENQYSKREGIEEIDGKLFTKYVAVDYTDEELADRVERWRQSASCTPFQGRMALADAGLLSGVESAVTAADEKTRVAWEYALIWQRNSPMIATLAAVLNMTEVQIDELFKSAAQISA